MENKIKKKVLKKWFGVDNLNWTEDCPKDELTKEDVLGCIDLAIRETSKEITKNLLRNCWKNIKENVADIKNILTSLEKSVDEKKDMQAGAEALSVRIHIDTILKNLYVISAIKNELRERK